MVKLRGAGGWVGKSPSCCCTVHTNYSDRTSELWINGATEALFPYSLLEMRSDNHIHLLELSRLKKKV